MHTKKTPKASVMVPLQNEFWLPAIQVPKKAGPIPCLQVDLLRFPVLLGPMALWVLQFLHALLQMDLFLRHQLHSDHHLNKVAVSTLPCKCLGHHSLGRGSRSNLLKHSHHRLFSSSGHLPRACRPHLHKHFRGRPLRQLEWLLLHLFGDQCHRRSSWQGGSLLCLRCQCRHLLHPMLLHLHLHLEVEC